MPFAWDTMIEFETRAENSRPLHDNGDDNNDDNDNGERSMLPNSPHT